MASEAKVIGLTPAGVRSNKHLISAFEDSGAFQSPIAIQFIPKHFRETRLLLRDSSPMTILDISCNPLRSLNRKCLETVEAKTLTLDVSRLEIKERAIWLAEVYSTFTSSSDCYYWNTLLPVIPQWTTEPKSGNLVLYLHNRRLSLTTTLMNDC